MSTSENSILNFFKACGFEIEKIPESNEKSPDFLLNDGKHTFLLELKQKFDSDELIKTRNNAFDKNSVFEQLNVVQRTNRNSNIIKSASKQLLAQKKKFSADFCIIVFEATGLSGELKRDQFKSSLYGTVELMNLGDNYVPPKTCYFYENSDFYNQRDVLDASFIFSETEGQLCLNPLSPNYEHFKQSSLVELFHKGVVDPIYLEQKKFAYVVNGAVNRKDKQELEQYLSQKYGFDRLVPFNYPELSHSFRVEVES